MNVNNDFPYSDIVNLPHHVSSKHPHMSAADRAAQFAPFAALTGFGALVTETARLTDERRDMDEYEKDALSERLSLLRDSADQQPEISVTFFRPDGRKSGGAYVTVGGAIKKYKEDERRILMIDGTEIPIDDIYAVDGALFAGLEME